MNRNLWRVRCYVQIGLLIRQRLNANKTQHTRWNSAGRVISPTQRPLPDDTQHSQETDLHVPGRIRTLNPSKRAAADRSIRRRGHRNRQLLTLQGANYDPGSNPGGDEIFPAVQTGPSHPPVKWVSCLYRGKAAGAWCQPSIPSYGHVVSELGLFWCEFHQI
jgi:hypothetical protein